MRIAYAIYYYCHSHCFSYLYVFKYKKYKRNADRFEDVCTDAKKK